jgi:3-dehydroquinate synthase
MVAAAPPSRAPLVVQSHRGPYRVVFDEDALERLAADPPTGAHFLVDRRLADLHRAALQPVLDGCSHLLIEATEVSKSLDRMQDYVERLLERKVRRNHVLVAVGGGIIQDITCFLASTLLRGLEWRFYPTTLLAQADSCIGSKSSINVGSAKNLMGTFYPPSEIRIATRVLRTLDTRDVHSGVGEMLKAHAIDGPESFDRIATDYAKLFEDALVMAHYVARSLEIKRGYVEQDEFDRGARNVMNYGHSFGHAIESATEFAVPHGIAVTIGMDMANFVAFRLNMTARDHFDRMHATLAANYGGWEAFPVPLAAFFAALGKDKKNVGESLRLVLPNESGRPAVGTYPFSETFRSICRDYLAETRRS